MIEFRTLGVLDLRDASGAKVSAVLVHPKRTALLAYLALATPRGFHRRDTLLALLWPESTQEHARASLRKAVHHLRRALGDDAIIGSGDEGVSLNPDVVRCDAVAFEIAIDANATSEAFEHYRGPLMNGFVLSEAPEFERWLDLERARLRVRAFDAAWREAERQANAGHAFEAAMWGRRAATLAPDDEAGLRRLIALLERLGDRAGAVSAYEDFARRLREDFDTEPSAETQTLIARVRGASAKPAVRTTPSSTSAPPLVPAANPIPTTRESRRIRQLAIALAIVAVIAGAWGFLRQDTPAAPNTVAVLPFEFRGDAQHAYLAAGVASLLGTTLDGIGGFQTANGNDARQYIKGDVVEAGGRVRINAALYDSREASRPSVRASVEDSTSQLFSIVDRLVSQLVVGRADTTLRLTKAAARTTSSLPALKAYLDGEQRFRIGHYKEAVDAFQKAVAADTTFALAYYRLAVAYSWSSDTMAHPTALKAARFAERLTTPDRALVEAFVPYTEGDAEEAERRYRAILQTRPFEGEAWYPLGEVLFHDNPIRGRPIGEAKPLFERAMALGASDSPLTHLLEIAAIDADYAAFDSLLPGIAAGAHFDQVGRTVHALTRGSDADRKAIIAELRGAPDVDLAQAARHMLFLVEDREQAATVVRLLLEPRRTPEVQALGYILLAHLEAAAGRWRAADSALTMADPLDHARAMEHRALIQALPFLPFPERERAATLAALERWNPSVNVPANAIFEADENLHESFRQYALGVTYAIAKRPEDALRAASQLVQSGPARSAEFLRGLSHAVRGRVAWERDDPAGSLAEMEQARAHVGLEMVGIVPFFNFAPERFLHAEALRVLGRDEEASSWYQAFGEHSPFARVYLAVAERRLGEIEQRRGRLEEAARHFERFARLWRDADPELKPHVADAEARVRDMRRRRSSP
jgi:serine/threonine-protein kinase